jgi:ArsR family transcriptional regulator, arsenate/arsenite/antimonite-responsive transcriptional repressor
VELFSIAHSPKEIACHILYFWYYRTMMRKDTQDVTRYADMFAAMGAEPRLRIMQLLLTAHPQGLVVGDIQEELAVPASTLSHHLDKLKNEELVRVRREGTFLWYTANTESLQEIINFLYAECCTRNKAIEPRELVTIGKSSHQERERKNR